MNKTQQVKTPLFDALKEYVKNETIPFHVPGHKKGQGIFNEFKEFKNKLISIFHSYPDSYELSLVCKCF